MFKAFEEASKVIKFTTTFLENPRMTVQRGRIINKLVRPHIFTEISTKITLPKYLENIKISVQGGQLIVNLLYSIVFGQNICYFSSSVLGGRRGPVIR